jgi:hypothetical protein
MGGGGGNNENEEEKGWRLRGMATRVPLDEAGAGWVASGMAWMLATVGGLVGAGRPRQARHTRRWEMGCGGVHGWRCQSPSLALLA